MRPIKARNESHMFISSQLWYTGCGQPAQGGRQWGVGEEHRSKEVWKAQDEQHGRQGTGMFRLPHMMPKEGQRELAGEGS